MIVSISTIPCSVRNTISGIGRPTKLFTEFNLADRVPKSNFYRRLKAVLDLRFLYEKTKPYYGTCGQKSIDPVVFFKLMLIGYLENIISDRQLLQHCAGHPVP